MQKSSVLVGLFFVVGLSACDDSTEDDSIGPSAIILECTDDKEKGTEKEGFVKTLRVYEGNEYQTAIQYYHQEGRFFQPCLERMKNCQLSVNSRFIEEIGQIGETQYITSINRTTGRVEQIAFNPAIKPMTIWQGDCVIGEEPAERATKF